MLCAFLQQTLLLRKPWWKRGGTSTACTMMTKIRSSLSAAARSDIPCLLDGSAMSAKCLLTSPAPTLVGLLIACGVVSPCQHAVQRCYYANGLISARLLPTAACRFLRLAAAALLTAALSMKWSQHCIQVITTCPDIEPIVAWASQQLSRFQSQFQICNFLSLGF